MTPNRKELITQQIARMVAVDMQPFTIVEDQGFLELLNMLVPSYEIPSRGTIADRVKLLYSQMESQLKQKLSAINYVALTTNTWTSCHMEAFLGVTVDYVDREWNLNCNLLQCAEMPE